MNARKTAWIVAIVLVALAALPAPSSAQGVMFVKNNRVGVGTSNPSVGFHYAQPGQAQFLFESTTLSSKWNFKINGNGYLVFSKLGSLAAEVLVLPALDQFGTTFRVNGSAQATAFNATSSRAAKQDFQEIDNREVLYRLAELPISQWTFKSDRNSVPHVGPMAEDFNAAFGVGSDSSVISLTDANGVTMAAIQGLFDLVQEKDRQIEELVKRVEALEGGLSQSSGQIR